MNDRHEKWQRVEPGTVIPAGQPYRVEFNEKQYMSAREFRGDVVDWIAGATRLPEDVTGWFVDSSWKPPPALPTEPCVIRAKVRGPVPYRVLFGHPNTGEEGGMTFCRDVDGLTYKADEIESFEVLWTENP